MAVQPINTLKGWFETQDKPTQDQFWDFLDSYRHKANSITWTDLDNALKAMFNSFGRVIILPDGTYQCTILAGTLIEKFWFGEWPTTHGVGPVVYTVRIGTTPGGNEIADDFNVDMADPGSGILGTDKYCTSDTVIYFTCTPPVGDPNKALIKIFKS